MKTADLIGPALDWAVASIECDAGWLSRHLHLLHTLSYSTDWSQGGPIIERELIDVLHVRQNDLSVAWDATFGNDEIVESGPTLLIAAMRCYCCSKLGDEVDIPEELCQSQNS